MQEFFPIEMHSMRLIAIYSGDREIHYEIMTINSMILENGIDVVVK